MRYLILSEPTHMLPPEMAPQILTALQEWADRYTQNGKMEDVFGFAGKQGGGGILNVNSHEELTSIMAEFPAGPFSTTQIIPLVDLKFALEANKTAMEHMMPQVH